MIEWIKKQRMDESFKQRLNESVGRKVHDYRTAELMNRWSNEPVSSVSHCIIEALIQWSNESTNQWTMNQWIYDPRTLHSSMVQSTTNEWMVGRTTLLCSAISSLGNLFAQVHLSYFFSHHALIWATCAPSCLPASSCVSSAVLLFVQLLHCVWRPPAATPLSTRAPLWSKTIYSQFYTVFSTLQLQSC